MYPAIWCGTRNSLTEEVFSNDNDDEVELSEPIINDILSETKETSQLK